MRWLQPHPHLITKPTKNPSQFSCINSGGGHVRKAGTSVVHPAWNRRTTRPAHQLCVSPRPHPGHVLAHILAILAHLNSITSATTTAYLASLPATTTDLASLPGETLSCRAASAPLYPRSV